MKGRSRIDFERRVKRRGRVAASCTHLSLTDGEADGPFLSRREGDPLEAFQLAHGARAKRHASAASWREE